MKKIFLISCLIEFNVYICVINNYDMTETEKHYEKSKKEYKIKGESHLEYYRQKYPENYKLLKKKYNANNK